MMQNNSGRLKDTIRAIGSSIAFSSCSQESLDRYVKKHHHAQKSYSHNYAQQDYPLFPWPRWPQG
jgi:hypothetical protein